MIHIERETRRGKFAPRIPRCLRRLIATPGPDTALTIANAMAVGVGSAILGLAGKWLQIHLPAASLMGMRPAKSP